MVAEYIMPISLTFINNLSDDQFIKFHKNYKSLKLQGGPDQVQSYNERKLKLIKNEQTT